MKKIPTMFLRDWNGDRSRVTREPNPACRWVFDGEGVATRKYDGACCMVHDGKLYKRRELIRKRRLSDIFDVIMPCALMEISATCQRRHLINTKPPFGDFMVQNVVREYIERQT